VTDRRNLRRRLFMVVTRLAFLSEKERDALREEHQALEEDGEEGDNELSNLFEFHQVGSKPDANQPTFKEQNKSRYKLEPGHGQYLSDLLMNTAERIIGVTTHGKA